LVIERASWWRGVYELWEDGVMAGVARPLGILRRENVVRLGGRDYRLRAAGFWGRVWHLLDDAGQMLVEVRPRGIFRRGAVLRILGPVDVDLLILAYHVVNGRWREQTAAAGASAGAAAGS
jgi:hypothetical protein